MEAVIDGHISSEELLLRSAHYLEELAKGEVSYNTVFDYGLCLIFSRKQEDNVVGSKHFEDLYNNGDTKARRDFLFFTAVGLTRICEFEEALECIEKILMAEPENTQAQNLRVIEGRLKKSPTVAGDMDLNDDAENVAEGSSAFNATPPDSDEDEESAVNILRRERKKYIEEKISIYMDEVHNPDLFSSEPVIYAEEMDPDVTNKVMEEAYFRVFGPDPADYMEDDLFTLDLTGLQTDEDDEPALKASDHRL